MHRHATKSLLVISSRRREIFLLSCHCERSVAISPLSVYALDKHNYRCLALLERVSPYAPLSRSFPRNIGDNITLGTPAPSWKSYTPRPSWILSDLISQTMNSFLGVVDDFSQLECACPIDKKIPLLSMEGYYKNLNWAITLDLIAAYLNSLLTPPAVCPAPPLIFDPPRHAGCCRWHPS
jgi:hypothetical protein